MKQLTRILCISLSLALGITSLMAQTQQDTSSNRERHQQRAGQEFIDENGDGIDDRTGRGPGAYQRGKDRFVDEDGDGICDSRMEGLGFRHRAGIGSGTGLMKGPDGKAKGRRGGSGGKP
ncbi:MAG TPA: hypothetical protein DCZ69_13930 [Syntrophobacteraceae bacterium]|nr:hypothetical protein [Syntrophobacteraceae bacterium]